jgi:magnesium transporter
VLEIVAPATLAKALEELDSDDAADVVDDLDEAKRASVLAAMPAHERTAIEASLAYEDETAGRLMQREVALAPQFWTVGQAMDHLSREARRCRSCSSTSTWSIRRCGRSAPRR